MAKYFFCLVAVLAWVSSSYAINCEPVALKSVNKTIILSGVQKPRTSQVYFLKNRSNRSIWIDHPHAHHAMNAGWSSFLHNDKWSAIVLNRKNFSLSCVVISPGKVDNVDCERALSVCMPKTTHAAARKGTYWVVEDKSLVDLLKIASKKGFVFE